jgi:hypothetical protein
MGYSIGWDDLGEGFSLNVLALPAAAVAAAFSAFGITGVGASELYAYPYWCLEKGYGRSTGPRTDDPRWAERARGWMRVMYLDAWVSMVVFTVATVAFYCLGATVLHRQGLHPEKERMIETLSEMYVPAFGTWTKIVFLVGAWAVLFKTLYVSSASNSRLTADFLSLTRMVKYAEAGARTKWITRFCVFYPVFLETRSEGDGHYRRVRSSGHAADHFGCGDLPEISAHRRAFDPIPRIGRLPMVCLSDDYRGRAVRHSALGRQRPLARHPRVDGMIALA